MDIFDQIEKMAKDAAILNENLATDAEVEVIRGNLSNDMKDNVITITTGNQSTTSTTYQTIVGLSLLIKPDEMYRIDCTIPFRTAATGTGAGFGFNTGLLVENMFKIEVPITAVAANNTIRGTFKDIINGEVLGTATSSTSTTHYATINGIITNTTASDLVLIFKFRTEVNNSAATVYSPTLIAEKLN
jgi:molybdopterin-binding protein